jgi:hypothetical protein
MLQSIVCRTDELETPEFRVLCTEFREPAVYHRKQWEFCYIARVLQERGMLAPGKRGIGFAVGREPLTAYFAKCGAEILATDLDPNAESGVVEGWQSSHEHAANAAEVNERNICPADQFARLVKFAYVDMNRVPDGLNGYDFLWSACAVEHVGGLDLSKRAVVNMMKCLKPGGIAIHTTEYNCVSNFETTETGYNVIYRKKDLEELGEMLRGLGHLMVPLDLRMGSQFADHYVDEPPYKRHPHMKIRLGEYVATSVGMIIIADGVRLARENPSIVGGRVTKAPSLWSRLFGGERRAA